MNKSFVLKLLRLADGKFNNIPCGREIASGLA
jgi:hypothetical protein